MQEKGVVAEGDEEPQVLVGLYLNSQPEEQEQETRRKRAVRANNRDRESGLKKFSNVRYELSTIRLKSNLYTLDKIRMCYNGNKTVSEKI